MRKKEGIDRTGVEGRTRTECAILKHIVFYPLTQIAFQLQGIPRLLEFLRFLSH